VNLDLPITNKSKIGKEILTYLVEHPEAQDTVEGIAEWWLLEQRIREQISVIEKALSELVDKGFVLEQSGRNGRTRYLINRRKQRQIKAFLDQRQNNADCNCDNGHTELPKPKK
jgi:predicted transcriptional regulator